MILGDDSLQTCNTTLMLSGHVSKITLAQGSDSKYKEICFNRDFIITQTRKIKQIRVCLGLLQDVLFTVHRDKVDIPVGSICRERESAKTSLRW